jgi:tetratricopeptide (TPR) repeat protein
MSDSAVRPDVEALRLANAGRFLDALSLAERATAGAHTCLRAHGLLATILHRLGRFREAEAVVLTALACEPGEADAYDGLAHVSMLLGQHERANALYRRTVELASDNPRFWYNLASSHRSLGQLDEAEAACDRSIALDPTEYPSYLLRSELRVQTEATNHIAQLDARLARPDANDRARMFLGYALAKELDDLERCEEAFSWFTIAAATRRKHLSYDVATDERKMRRIAEAFSTSRPESSGTRQDAGRHIFIVGLPRSGTTLVERILGGLAAVRSNGETDNFSRALFEASPAEGGDVFARAAAAEPGQVASNYVKLAGDSEPGVKIIEKLPMNYLYLGAIHRALPGATLLSVRRAALDSCFAMYRTLFGSAYPFSYDFQELARYFAAYEQLMRHWRDTLGGSVFEIDYDELVRDPGRTGSGIAARSGLAWSAAALDIQKNAAASLTASAAQVRRPIYGSSSGRWRRYAKHLGPLIHALRERHVLVAEDA